MTQRVPAAGDRGASDARVPDVADARRGVLAYLVAVIVLSGAGRRLN